MRTFLALLFVFTIFGCTPKVAPPNGEKRVIKVVTTVGMIRDAVLNIGGTRVQVQALMGPGVDPHLYRATAKDLQKLEEAEIIFYGGLELEGRMSEILEKLSTKKKVAAVSEAIPKDKLRMSAQFHGKPDPHVWFDVELWIIAVGVVRDTLVEADPEKAEFYKTNAEAYIRHLEDLDQKIKSQIPQIPEEKRVLITAHDAFGYFGARYGLEVIGIQGTSTASEAGAADIVRIADLIAKRKVKSIFVESSVPKNTIEALQKAVQSRGWDVKIGGSLYSDAMGNEGTPEGNYIGMVLHNVQTIVNGLK